MAQAPRPPSGAVRSRPPAEHEASLWSPGDALAWIAALVYMLSAFMAWYSGTIDGITLSVIGWDTGTIGKLVFFVGLGLLIVLALRVFGLHPPPALSGGAMITILGTTATILILIRVINPPEDIEPTGRSIGLWISLASAVLMIVAGLLRAAEES